VPAAAVIPAPIAYIKVVAVKTFVVENLLIKVGWLTEYVPTIIGINSSIQRVILLGSRICYFEEIRVFQAGAMP
jgi:hypothetical protein